MTVKVQFSHKGKKTAVKMFSGNNVHKLGIKIGQQVDVHRAEHNHVGDPDFDVLEVKATPDEMRQLMELAIDSDAFIT